MAKPRIPTKPTEVRDQLGEASNGIASPFIIRWPQTIKNGGTLTNHLAHITDIMPTCLELAGAQYPKTRNNKDITPLPGHSLIPALPGNAPGSAPGSAEHQLGSDRTLYWEHFGNRAIRQGKWKLVATKDGEWELYDLEAGRTELHSLLDQFPEKAKELNQAWETWAEDCGVKLPGKRK